LLPFVAGAAKDRFPPPCAAGLHFDGPGPELPFMPDAAKVSFHPEKQARGCLVSSTSEAFVL